MGHLIKIANNVVEKVDGHLSEFVKENVEPDMIASWEQFVASKLLAVNQVQKQCLVSWDHCCSSIAFPDF